MRWGIILAAAIACGGTSGPPQETPDQDENETPRPAPEAVTAEPSPDPAPEPTLRIWAETEAGSATIHVENRGTAPVSLRSGARFETRGEDGWQPLQVEWTLRADCEATPAECVTLAVGAELIPPPWTGDRGDAQCGCERCTPVDPGAEVRVVVESCAPEGTTPHEVAGETFAVTR